MPGRIKWSPDGATWTTYQLPEKAKEIRGLAATGGVIGVGYWPGAVCDTSPGAIVRAMAHIRDLVGVEHVALGSDFDGTVTTRFDTAGLVHVTQALMDADFTEEEIRAVMGGNSLRILENGLEPLAGEAV